MRVPDSHWSGSGRTPEEFAPTPRTSGLSRSDKDAPQGGMSQFAAVALLPWLVFSLIVALFALAFQAFQPVVWASVAACVMLALLFVAMGGRRGRPSQLAVGLLILGAVAIAVPIGRFVDLNFMAEFWRLDAGAAYRRLSPLDPGASHADATMVEFQEGTFVDVQRALGYMKDGIVYCVAPITRAGANQSQAPEYWAAGEDCCERRGNFACGDVESRTARSGLAVFDDEGHYRTAVRMAQSTYELSAAPGAVLAPPVLLRWTESPSSYMDSLLKGALTFASVACVVHLLGSGCAGAVLVPRLSR